MADGKDKKNKQSGKAVRRTSIGGQAVLEGVMMKGARSMATAVRAPSGDITVESKYIKSAKEKNAFLRLPFIRGVVNLVSQLFQGTGIIMRSAEVYGDYAEPSKLDKWMADKLKINPMNLLMAFSVILGIGLAVGLFVFLPNFLASLICDNIPSISAGGLKSLWYSLIEGGIMLVIFICYILLVTLMKDVRRVFMYHGAEHKVISCYEHGLDLTVENAKKMRREHSRCGTTFLFFVVAVSIIVFVLINFMLERCSLLDGRKAVDALIKLGFKLLFLPVVAGTSYEILKLLAKSDCLLVRILRAPGMALQKLTTKEPTDDMLEVSLVAFKTVMEMDENPNLPERKFDINVPYGVARKRLESLAKCADEADIDWIIAETTGVKRSELSELKTLTKAQFDSATEIAKRMSDGKPLQYALGNADFYGVRIAVNQNVLIPRPETEELVEKALAEIKCRQEDRREVKALDLCTGSGAIAVVVAKKTGAKVLATDISGAAVDVARANALNEGADVEFAVGDLWSAADGVYDVIISNPPYIPTADIESLDEKVKNFEPSLALDGGNDGLDFYRRIEKCLDSHLAAGGVLLLEFGINQAEAIKCIFNSFEILIDKDMEGVERIARVWRKNENK